MGTGNVPGGPRGLLPQGSHGAGTAGAPGSNPWSDPAQGPVVLVIVLRGHVSPRRVCLSQLAVRTSRPLGRPPKTLK